MNATRVTLCIAMVVCIAAVAGAQTEWVEYPDNPVIGPGDPGAWDAGGHSAGSVLFDGELYHMWVSGRSEDGKNTIGHATSIDGVVWDMDPANPVLTRGEPGEWDAELLFSPVVIHDESMFLMWYGGGDGTVQQVGYATSPDGTTWTKHPDNPVMEVAPSGSDDDWIVRPGAVLLEGGTYRMWFFGSSQTTGVAHVGYAESADGVQWTKSSEPALEVEEIPGPGSWEEGAVGNPTVAFDGSMYHMWYVAGYDRLPPNGRVYIGYAFSSDGFHWTKHRDNPVIQTADNYAFMSAVIFDGSAWQMWYSHTDGPSDWISYATSDCCPGVAALSHSQFIPAAAVASGAEGAYYQTDVDLNNAGEQPVEYEFMWLPRGEDCSDPTTSDTFTLGAGMSVRYGNHLSEVFGLEPNALGALLVLSSSPDLLAMSRTYNIPDDGSAGTFGQAIPAVARDGFIQSGERRRILFASENDELRFNIGCQNGSGELTAVSVELFDGEGTSLERATMVLPAWGNDQLNRIFEDYAPVNGYVDVWTVQSGRSFTCYGSVLDNVTSDPTTVLPQ